MQGKHCKRWRAAKFAVLIFIDEQPAIGRRKNVQAMSSLQHFGSSDTNTWIVLLRFFKLQDFWVCGAARWKRRNKPHAPAIDGEEAVGARRHASFFQAATERSDPRVRVSQDENWLLWLFYCYGFSDQVRLAAPSRGGYRAALDVEKVDPCRH
jgi:hypothetical protein